MATPSIYQQAIFNWVTTGRGHAIVNAVAGSGKTWTLVEAAKLLKTDRAIFCAFNKHIQEELSKRLPKHVTVKTLHGIGYGALAAKWGKLRLNEDKLLKLSDVPALSIHKALMALAKKEAKRGFDMDVPDLADIAGWIRRMAHFARVSLTDHHDIDALSGMADYYGIDVDPVAWDGVAKAVAAVIDESTRIAQEKHTIDYDEMVYLPVKLGISPVRYDWVCLDEAQDLSAAQRALAISCLAPGGRMLAVGDPRQSIQGFAGADPQSFESLKAELNAVELPLSVCYRCPTSHLAIAREIVPQIEAAPGAGEGLLEHVNVDDLLTRVQEGDLILSRKTAPAVRICIQLIARKIPARVKGRDIGAGLARDVAQIADLPGFKMDHFGDFAQQWAEKREAKISSKKNASEAQIKALWDRYEGLMACYEAFPAGSAEELARSIQALFSDERRSVTLSTIHRAKGLEADRVWVLGADDLPFGWRGILDWEAYQEDCLHYVALTRAKRELYLVKTKPKETGYES